MTLAVKAAAAALCACLLALTVRRSNPELALGIAVAAATGILYAALEAAAGLSGLIDEALSLCRVDAALFAPVAKCVGVGIITRLACDLCKDAGQASAASAVELAGAAAALLCAAPLLQTMLRTILSY